MKWLIRNFCFMCGDKKSVIVDVEQGTVTIVCFGCGSAYPAEPTRKLELFFCWIISQYNKACIRLGVLNDNKARE